MKLSELYKILSAYKKQAKKLGVDPEVKIVVNPTFPILTAMHNKVVSTLDEDMHPDAKPDSKKNHTIFIAEGRHEYDMFGVVVEALELD